MVFLIHGGVTVFLTGGHNRIPDYWLRGPILKLAFQTLPSAWILAKFIRSNIRLIFEQLQYTFCIGPIQPKRIAGKQSVCQLPYLMIFGTLGI